MSTATIFYAVKLSVRYFVGQFSLFLFAPFHDEKNTGTAEVKE